MLASPLAFACTLALAAQSTSPTPAPPRPHIVLVLADDLGFSDIGCYGSEIQTPELDALAAGGLRFTQFYNTGRCCPTRASLLTGLYPHQAGIGHMVDDRGHDGYRGDLNDRCVTLAEVLRSAGYRTAMVGKWHVTKAIGPEGPRDGWPRQRGFDEFFGTIHGAGSYFAPNTLTEGNTRLDDLPDDFYYTDAIGARAAAIVRAHDGATPLFLYVAFTAPHWPLHALPADIAAQHGRYDLGFDAVRAARFARQRQRGIVDAACELAPRDPGEKAWDDVEDHAWQAARMEVYAAQVAAMDRAVGVLRRALADSGKLDDTLFLFLADNGGCAEGIAANGGNPASIPLTTRDGRPVRRGNDHDVLPGPADTYQSYGRAWANASNTPFRRYKHWVHEGGIASPLLVHWPKGIAARGALRHTPTHLIDVMPTCVAVAGATYPTEIADRAIQPMEGTSLLPVFADDTLRERDLFFEHEGNRAVRRGAWKLVAAGARGPFELYDMHKDRTELHDLAAREPARAAAMAAAWQAWAQRCQVLPLNPTPAGSRRAP